MGNLSLASIESQLSVVERDTARPKPGVAGIPGRLKLRHHAADALRLLEAMGLRGFLTQTVALWIIRLR